MAVGTERDKETHLILSSNGECVILSIWESSALLSASVKRELTNENPVGVAKMATVNIILCELGGPQSGLNAESSVLGCDNG